MSNRRLYLWAVITTALWVGTAYALHASMPQVPDGFFADLAGAAPASLAVAWFTGSNRAIKGTQATGFATALGVRSTGARFAPMLWAHFLTLVLIPSVVSLGLLAAIAPGPPASLTVPGMWVYSLTGFALLAVVWALALLGGSIPGAPPFAGMLGLWAALLLVLETDILVLRAHPTLSLNPLLYGLCTVIALAALWCAYYGTRFMQQRTLPAPNGAATGRIILIAAYVITIIAVITIASIYQIPRSAYTSANTTALPTIEHSAQEPTQ